MKSAKELAADFLLERGDRGCWLPERHGPAAIAWMAPLVRAAQIEALKAAEKIIKQHALAYCEASNDKKRSVAWREQQAVAYSAVARAGVDVARLSLDRESEL